MSGSLPLVFSDYSVTKPNIFSVLSADGRGTMEFYILFVYA